MKFVIAPDSFKESMDALTAAQSIQSGLKDVFPEAHFCLFPMADGGEGTLQAVKYYAKDAQSLEATVRGPLGSHVSASLIWIPSKAEVFIEMAEAAGIMLLEKEQRNPLYTSTYGVGELFEFALSKHPKRIVIALGGSVTNDGGMGFLQALGVVFNDQLGQELPAGGRYLGEVDAINNSKRLGKFKNVQIIVLTDVKNRLLGTNGATLTYGPQKGADTIMLDVLEEGMKKYATVMENHFGKIVRNAIGSGAAGGLGFALQFLPNVDLVSGFDYVAELSNIEEMIADCDVVFIGEGSLDRQSLQGKVPIGIANLAKKYHKPVVALVGTLKCNLDELSPYGIDMVYPINEANENLPNLLKAGPKNLAATAKKVGLSLKERGLL
ncbi:MAG: glycerate kinase [Bacilli bacterium]|nr:glycerate kinase [Bacilli bacterium]MBN2696394.1 glycerate kinase [Bacilli bacterium]